MNLPLFITLLIGGLLCLADIPAAAADAVAPECAVCGAPIRGRYLTANGKAYCSEACLARTRPRCSVCNRRCGAEYLTSGDRAFCSRNCLEKTLPVCRVCGRKLVGAYRKLLTPDGELLYCNECAALPRCFSCRLPARGTTLPDGRHLCSDCARAPITDPGEAGKIFEQTRTLVSRLLGDTPSCRLQFFLADRPLLQRRLAESGRNWTDEELGLYHFEQNSRILYRNDRPVEERVLNRRCAIYVLDHLPRERFIESCAHEIAHDWMQHHAGVRYPEDIREGFAEYVAALADRASGRPEMVRRMESNPDPVYGGGYRKVAAYAQQHGLNGLLTALRQGKPLR